MRLRARNPRRGHHNGFPVALSDFFWACATQSHHVPYWRGRTPPIVRRLIEEQSEENGGMNGSEDSCGRRRGDSFEDFGQRPADAPENRFGIKDDGPANVQLGEEGSKRLAL
jgi:hypothetical protein